MDFIKFIAFVTCLVVSAVCPLLAGVMFLLFAALGLVDIDL